MVASVHQPSSRVFYAFDQLLLLSQGRTAFCGQAADAMEYFEFKCGLKPGARQRGSRGGLEGV
eukprot:257925-Prorocentrum_minimum.AAC.1